MTNSEYKILSVEDDPSLQDVICMILEHEGYNIERATTGAEAREKTSAQKYDLILLDRILPDLLGHNILLEIKRGGINMHTPVIFVTSLSDEEDIAHGYECGAADYIHKPVSFEILRHRVALHLRVSKHLNEGL